MRALKARRVKVPGGIVVEPESKQKGDVQNGSVHQPLGANVSPRASSPQANLQKSHAEQQRPKKVNDSSKPGNRRQEADTHKRRSRHQNLPERPRALGVDHRKHQNSRARIILAIHPSNRVKMRELPEEKNREQQPSAKIEPASGGHPPNHRRNRPGKRTDKRSPHSALLQRRVRQQITEARCNAQSSRKRARRAI